MIYIIGFKFKVGATQVEAGGSILQNYTKAALQKNAGNGTDFTSGLDYEVYYFKKITDGYEYTFKELVTKRLIKKTFPDIPKAEMYIARISGQLDNYTSAVNSIKNATENASRE